MELYKNTANAFIDYLKQHNYPDNSIVLEWGTKNCVVDIAIVDNDLTTPIAIYEIKGQKTERTISQGIRQLKRVVQTLNIAVSCSLVFSLSGRPYFEVLDVSDIVYNDTQIPLNELLAPQPLIEPVSYKNMTASATSKAVTKNREKKQKKIDRIKLLCWFLFPAVGLLWLRLDAQGIYILTPLRLVLAGAVVILILVPFFSEITLKDFSFKRKDK